MTSNEPPNDDGPNLNKPDGSNPPPPPPGGYPQQGGNYPPPQGSYPPPQGNYPPPQGSYPPPAGGYPPPGQGPGGFPPPPPYGGPGQPGFGGQSGFAGQPGFGGQPATVSVGDALGYGWARFKGNAGVWIGMCLIAVVVSGVINAAFSWDRYTNSDDLTVSASFSLLSIIGSLVSVIVSIIFQAAFTRGALSETDGVKPGFGDFFRFKALAPVFGVAILVGLINAVAFILCFLPVLITGYLLWYSLTFVIDRDLDPIAAIKASFKLTTENVGQLLPLALVCVLLNIGGAILCLVGLLVTIPVTLLAGVYAYRVLTGGPVAPVAA